MAPAPMLDADSHPCSALEVGKHLPKHPEEPLGWFLISLQFCSLFLERSAPPAAFFTPFFFDTHKTSSERGRRPWVFPAMPSPPRHSQGQGEAWRWSAAEPAHPRGRSGRRQPWGEGELDLWGFMPALSIVGAVSAGGGGTEGWMLRCIVAEEAFWGGGGGRQRGLGVPGSPPR